MQPPTSQPTSCPQPAYLCTCICCLGTILLCCHCRWLLGPQLQPLVLLLLFAACHLCLFCSCGLWSSCGHAGAVAARTPGRCPCTLLLLRLLTLLLLTR